MRSEQMKMELDGIVEMLNNNRKMDGDDRERMDLAVKTNETMEWMMEQLVRLMAGGCIHVAGDFVMKKEVHYEVANVEAGGIGISVRTDKAEVASADMAKEVPDEDGAVVEEVDVLDSPEAWRLWDIARERKWVDKDRQPLISMNKAAILASVMADVLELSPRWAAFERLWRVSILGSKLCKAMDCSYYADTLREMEKALL